MAAVLVMKAIPAPEGMPFDELPTFDELRSGTDLKATALRARLIKVTCWKCSDNTVRYDAEAAAAALADGVEDDAEESAATELLGEKQPGLLFLFNKMLAILASQQKAANETIKVMGEPLRGGIELWKAQSERQEKRLVGLEENWDRMVKLIEVSLTAQHERELAVKRHAANAELRQQTFAMAKEQLPTIVQKWTVTAEAGQALELLRSIDPALIDVILASDALDEKQTALLQKFRATMKAPAPAPASTPAANGAP